MGDAVLAALLRAYDLCVSERASRKPFVLRLLTPPPAWLCGVVAEVPPGTERALTVTSPFLEGFLPQAEAAWHEGQEAVASSGPFAATLEGEEVLLVAMAISHLDRRLLILRRLTGDADLRPILQRAREQVLEQERLVRQIGALHLPCASIDRDTKALLAAPLAPDYLAVAARLSQASTEVQAVLATLPSPPSRQRRKARS